MGLNLTLKRSFLFVDLIRISMKLAVDSISADILSNKSGFGASIARQTSVTARATVSSLDKISNMQQMTPIVCSNTSPGVAKSLVDVRNSRSYTITKLADNRCWMSHNNLMIGSNSSQTELASTYSHTNGTYYLPQGNLSQFSHSYPQREVAYIYSSAQYGAAYTWCASTAGDCSNVKTNYQNARYDICPKGWRLPTAYGKYSSGSTPDSSVGEYIKLYRAYSSSFTNLTAAWGMTHSPHASDGSYGDYNDHFWTSTAGSTVNGAYGARISDDQTLTESYLAYGGGGTWRAYGFKIRCIAID